MVYYTQHFLHNSWVLCTIVIFYINGEKKNIKNLSIPFANPVLFYWQRILNQFLTFTQMTNWLYCKKNLYGQSKTFCGLCTLWSFQGVFVAFQNRPFEYLIMHLNSRCCCNEAPPMTGWTLYLFIYPHYAQNQQSWNLCQKHAHL